MIILNLQLITVELASVIWHVTQPPSVYAPSITVEMITCSSLDNTRRLSITPVTNEGKEIFCHFLIEIKTSTVHQGKAFILGVPTHSPHRFMCRLFWIYCFVCKEGEACPIHIFNTTSRRTHVVFLFLISPLGCKPTHL